MLVNIPDHPSATDAMLVMAVQWVAKVKDISRAAVSAPIVIPIRPDDGRVATDGHRNAEIVTRGGVAGG